MPALALLAIDWLAAVMTFNIVAVLLWFLLGALKRGHRMRIQRLRIAIEEIRQAHDDQGELADGLDEVLGFLQEAEDAGPLKGRAPLSAAHGAIAALVARVEAEGDDGSEGDEP